jgi:hypothetical protein
VEEKGWCFSTIRKGDDFLPLFFFLIFSSFKFHCGERMKMSCRAWMVVRSMVAASGEIGGCFGTGSMEDIGRWRLKLEKRRRYVYGY